MDLTFLEGRDIFHMRARGVILEGGRLLVLKDVNPYWYQTGGRISYGESSLTTLERELVEELHIGNFRIERPLFLDDHTFMKDGLRQHELVFYYLVDTKDTDLEERGDFFETIDDDHGTHHDWRWMTEHELEEDRFFPPSLLHTMFHLPDRFEIISSHDIEMETDNNLTYHRDEGWFNVRVAGVFIHDGKLLAMKDGKAPFFYLPGGRLHFGERIEDGIRREISEELQIKPETIRPLRISENFFDSVNHPGEFTHEICIYFLMRVTDELLERGDSFITYEEQMDTFSWIPFLDLPMTDIMPPFLRTAEPDVNHELIITEDRA